MPPSSPAPVDCDVLIIGGGPAGSLTAALLRRQCPELRVTLVEAVPFPRHHVGEACLPGWSPVLRRAGVLESFQERVEIDKLGFLFHWGPEGSGASWTADFRAEDGSVAPGSWHVDRAEMDAHFLERAVEAGAALLQPARVVAVVPREGPVPPTKGGPSPGFRVTVRWEGEAAPDEEILAGTVVDASGQARVLSRLWALPSHRHADMHNFAVSGYWRGGAVEDNGERLQECERWSVVSSCALGWVWHIPIRKDLASVGLVTDQETLRRIDRGDLLRAYQEAVQSAPQVGRLLEGARFWGDRPVPSAVGGQRVNVTRDWSYKAETMCGAGWYLVGDGALFVDPILASGLTLASTGASMVANAITTRVRRDTVDSALLDDSFEATYRDIAAAYHRMARVWYQRNSRSDSWHWQAHQERLRTAGPQALFENDAESFTAVCLGAVNSPLDAVLPQYSREAWGSEYFSWLTGDRLFGRVGAADDGRAQTRGMAEARDRSRWALMARWRQISAGAARLGRPWRVARGYHTNRMVSEWSPMHYVQVELDDPLDPDLRVACPAFPDAPEGVFPALDGSRSLREATAALVAGMEVGSPERLSRLKAATETVLQLHMLGLLSLEAPVQDATPPGASHPLLSSIGRVCTSVAPEARVVLEVGWLGACVAVTLDWGPERLRFRLSPRDRTARARRLGETSETAVDWARGVDARHDALIVALLKRLRGQERKRATWTQMSGMAALCLGLVREDGRLRVSLLSPAD